MTKKKRYIIIILIVLAVVSAIVVSIFCLNSKKASSDVDTPMSVEEYYKENSEILEVNEVTSDVTFSETEINDFLSERGFMDLSVSYRFSLEGAYDSQKEINNESDVKHPMYEAYYVSKNNEIYYLNIIGKNIYVNPISYCNEHNPEIPIIISENNWTTGYDFDEDKFFKIIPKDTAATLITIDKITAETLDSLRIEEVIKK